ncbi:MAG: Fic family protein [Dehalococcoidales bacterium]
MKKIELGKLIRQPAGFKAFIPNPFPPPNGFDLDLSILNKDNIATRLVGKLDGITKLLPDSDFLLLMYQRKDAASSSQIEGTKATMADAIEAVIKITDKTPPDVDDILHYIKTLNYGMNRLSEDNFPISLRFIRELHKELMTEARISQNPSPGEFRKSQNWIGGSRPDNAGFVPPPVDALMPALSDLERFIHTKDNLPVISKSGLIHAQFETIHPFLDGNGRTGRILIPFYLWQEKFLKKPVLFLSSYFRRNQNVYYQKLAAYHDGYVSAWLDFFLDGVIEIANEAIEIVERITALREKDINIVGAMSKRAAESASMILPKLYAQPIVDVATVQKWTGFTRAGAQRVIDRFIEKGILLPTDEDQKYGQTYVYKEYLDIFSDKN